MIDGLEVIPRKRVEYRGVAVDEMDTEAILRRQPAVCLVDELAHSNAPGSEREKRYEDVEVIRDAGINVVSTLNVQHLESLNDTVEALTGIRVRETIPDRVVDEADELILIDLSPEGARARMEHGHIYPPEQARAALENFFRQENLAQLREIALRRTAQEVDEQLDEYMREAAVRSLDMDEHVMVLVDETAASRTLIRRGWRIAQGLKADLLVGYYKRELDETHHAELIKTLELAEDLNAHIHALEPTGDEASAIAGFLQENGANHIVLPHRKRSAGARLRSRSLADRLMLAVPHLDVHLVASGE
jgi:two-component system sensor histidine kinase KdpD